MKFDLTKHEATITKSALISANIIMVIALLFTTPTSLLFGLMPLYVWCMLFIINTCGLILPLFNILYNYKLRMMNIIMGASLWGAISARVGMISLPDYGFAFVGNLFIVFAFMYVFALEKK
jgi:hypothetical protein